MKTVCGWWNEVAIKVAQREDLLYMGRTPQFLVLRNQGGDHERDYRHQLDEDVEGGAGRVFERITDGITYDGGFVGLASFTTEVAGFDVFYFLALSQAPPAFAMKIAIQTPEAKAPTRTEKLVYLC